MIQSHLCVILLQVFALVHGHGNMVKPLAWWDEEQDGWFYDEDGKDANLGCCTLSLPQDTVFTNQTGKCPDCMKMWFTPQTEITGEVTLPWDMSQPEVLCIGQEADNDPDEMAKKPWSAPGTAFIYSPCGTLGGAPNGCNDDGEGEFGECCGDSCGKFAMGDNAENYEWPDMPITEWTAGSFQEVAWFVHANHAGGYSYRLCKMPNGGISEVTEECFQQTPMEFVGNEQWVEYRIDRDTGKRTKLQALQTHSGTYPEESMWRANPLLPDREDGGSQDYGMGHVIDYVEVPADLEPGEYIVSHRCYAMQLLKICCCDFFTPFLLFQMGL